jgi:hypothetical protein
MRPYRKRFDMNKIANAIIGWAMSIAISSAVDKTAPKSPMTWSSPKRLGIVALGAIALDLVITFIEKAFAKPSKAEKIKISV